MKAVKIIAAILAVIMPFLVPLGIALAVPPQYSDTFVGALDEKFERLREIDEPKVVVVGGSSVAFGLESELLERYTDMPIVNFGLYAALGTKVMLDLSRSGIRRGDVVVLAPELDAETMSLFFNAKTVLEAVDDKPSMLLHIDPMDYPAVMASLFEHSADKLKYNREGKPSPDSVYNSASFNAYGDIEYSRPENIMELYYDPNKLISLDESILDEGFMDYINDYIAFCKRRGASVYFSYCPMNSMALTEGTTEADIAEFESALKSRLDCPVIGNIEDYIMDPGYFYDTNFHLNDIGSRFRTIRLCEDFLLATDNPTLVAEPYPEPPALEEGLIPVYGEILGEDLFTYERLANGNYMITGLTEAGRAATELTLPLGVRLPGLDYAAAITVIGEGAFSGLSATKIIIPKDTYLTQMNNGAFMGAASVRELYIYKPDSETLNPPANFMGTAEGFTIHAPENSEYKTGYFWSQVKGVDIILDLPAD